ncbi:N-acetylglucosaminyl-phosphatidylinositol de-N-acetylase-like [Ctenocephalides felis]|uniref:N-acetylglucosaminyl-phosphatidylinositol de-N-acetylase-like n=1 Tax=Ctenocephalides felis TaxID=7515 RepID=UPI000E6E28F1|nr:N-acetylglucosaminyl-phosphatidylinositol de-N-acetylase-like [Ctenocephalides felis]
MFFGPTVLQFNKMGCEIYLVCLSTGNHSDLGKTRKYELYEACKVLGISEDRITIHNDQFLPDNPNVMWKEDLIGSIIMNYVQSLNVDTLVSFDKQGISQHPNHKAIYYAIAYLVMENQLPSYCRAYTLETVNIFRKYSLFLDIPISFLSSSYWSILNWKERKRIQKAMKEHNSQMVWFRSLYITFSRYMLVNTLEEITFHNALNNLSQEEDKEN